MFSRKALGGALLATLLLTACGGGGENENAAESNENADVVEGNTNGNPHRGVDGPTDEAVTTEPEVALQTEEPPVDLSDPQFSYGYSSNSLIYGPLSPDDLDADEGRLGTLIEPEFWVVRDEDGNVRDVSKVYAEEGEVACGDVEGPCLVPDNPGATIEVVGHWPSETEINIERHSGEEPDDWRLLDEMEPFDTVAARDIEGWSDDFLYSEMDAEVEFIHRADQYGDPEKEVLHVGVRLPQESLDLITPDLRAKASLHFLSTDDGAHRNGVTLLPDSLLCDKKAYEDGCLIKVPEEVVDENLNWDMPFRASVVIESRQPTNIESNDEAPPRSDTYQHVVVTTLDEIYGTDSSDHAGNDEIVEEDFTFTREAGDNGVTLIVDVDEDFPVRLGGDRKVSFTLEDQEDYATDKGQCGVADFRDECRMFLRTQATDAPIKIWVTVGTGRGQEDDLQFIYDLD